MSHKLKIEECHVVAMNEISSGICWSIFFSFSYFLLPLPADHLLGEYRHYANVRRGLPQHTPKNQTAANKYQNT